MDEVDQFPDAAPLPWEFEGNGPSEKLVSIWSGSHLVGTVLREDAPLVCTAVNQHASLTARVAELEAALSAYDRMCLVIESAVRRGDSQRNYALVIAAIDQGRAALKGES